MRSADELIHSIMKCSQIVSAKRRQEIERELSAHVEDFVSAAQQAGHENDEIEELLLARFGDPRQVAEGFSWVYRYERRKLLIFAYVISTVLLGSCLLVTILAIQTGLAFSFGTPILKTLVGRHTVIQALDILAFLAVYLGLSVLETHFENHRFQKAALLLTGVVAILTTFCSVTGLHMAFLLYGLITGIFIRAVRLFVMAEAARAGIVLIAFGVAGFIFAVLFSPPSPVNFIASCTSWLALGAAYLLACELAPRIDAALRTELQRI